MQNLLKSMEGQYGDLQFSEKPIARAGFERVLVNGADPEKSEDEVAAAVTRIQSAMRAVNRDTEADWQRSRAIKSSICWGSIFLIGANYYFGWVQFMPYD